MYLGLYVWTESKAAGMGAPSSPVTPGHSWLCLDCWSYVALWSVQEKNYRQRDTQAGKYTLNTSINMSRNLVQLNFKLHRTLSQVWGPLMVERSNA